jgi:hypothetical protein
MYLQQLTANYFMISKTFLQLHMREFTVSCTVMQISTIPGTKLPTDRLGSQYCVLLCGPWPASTLAYILNLVQLICMTD